MKRNSKSGKNRWVAIAITFVGFSFFAYVDDAAAQACMNMATQPGQPWVGSFDAPNTINTTATVTLTEQTNNLLSGSITLTYDTTGASPNTCLTSPITYNVVEYSILNPANGQLSIKAQEVGSYPNCSTTIQFTGYVKGAGCTTASGTWTSSGGLTGSFSWIEPCVLPTGETPSIFTGWDPAVGWTTVAQFNTGPAPDPNNWSQQWAGRTVTEEFLQPADDSCWWANSALPKIRTNPNLSVKLSGTVPGYSDSVGPSEATVNYYRGAGRTPCGFINYQSMFIDCPSTVPPFATNNLVQYMGDTAVTDSRAGVAATRIWGAPAPIIYVIPAVVSTLLLKP